MQMGILNFVLARKLPIFRELNSCHKMKIFKRPFLGLVAIAAILVSCSKKKTDVLPAPVNSIVSSSTLATLKQYGTVINEGTTPPDITGVYSMTPDVCTFDNSAEHLTGETFNDYLYKFSKQDNKNFTVRFDFFSSDDDGEVDEGSDSTATFISGKNNLFTVFAQTRGTAYGIDYVSLEIISGEIQSTGIKNLQSTKYLQSKGDDPTGMLTEVGTTRIFYDSDTFSEKQAEDLILGLTNKPARLKSNNSSFYMGRGIRQ
jgi:hypothetical protein